MEAETIIKAQSPNENQTIEPNQTDNKGFKIAIIIGIIITIFLIIVGLPPIRDYILSLVVEEKRLWLRDNKQAVLAWSEWLKIIFEVTLGLFISNQIFNDSIRSWFIKRTQSLHNTLNAIVENSIENNDARVKIKKALLDIIISVAGSRKLHQLPDDLFGLFIAWQQLTNELKIGVWFLFLRLILLKLLNVFSGQLHSLTALLSFLIVLLMKTVKLYSDSPILK